MKYTLKQLAFLLLVFGVIVMPTPALGVGNSIKKPNIIFILVDDLGYGDLSCYNEKSPVRTSNIDGLAATGVRMTQAYAYPVSGLSRAAFLTGSFPEKIGVYSNNDAVNPGLGTHRESFVPIIQQSGYTTAWIGKWHQGWDVTNHPINNGFDRAYGFLGGTHNYLVGDEGEHYWGGEYSNLGYIFDDFKPVDNISHLSSEFTLRAIDFIGQSRGDKPFFLYLAYNAPHSPYQAPEDLVSNYLDKGYSGETAARYALIEDLDLQIGKLLSYLRESNLDENTLIVFTSDNGGEKQEYNGLLKGAKSSVWEGGIRVPMIASFSNLIPSDTSSDVLCSIVDLTATFIGLSQGKDNYYYRSSIGLMPYFKGKYSRNVHDELLFAYNVTGDPYSIPSIEALDAVALRKGNWKLVVDNITNLSALYNILEDSAEKQDLSSTHPEVKQELLKIIEARLALSSPASHRITKIDTRRAGDVFKADSIITHCKDLINSKLY